jgi:hypothetical protein
MSIAARLFTIANDLIPYTITDYRKRPVNGIFPNPRTCAKISPLQEVHGNGGYRWDEPG